MYGNMNSAADTYYGTLYSQLSYGMGENTGLTSGTNPNAEAAAAAAAAAMAAAAGRTDWSSPTGYAPNSGIVPGLTHPTAIGLNPGANPGDLSLPPCSAPSSTNLTSPYAATLLAAVAAAAAAAYPIPTVPPNTSSVSSGRSFLPPASVNNRSNAEFTTMYFGSTSRPPTSIASQMSGVYNNMTNWPFAVSTNHYPPNPNLLERSNSAMVPLDNWPSSGQNSQTTVSREIDVSGQFPHLHSDEFTIDRDLAQGFYTAHNVRDMAHMPSVTFNQTGSIDEFGTPYMISTANSKSNYPFSSSSQNPALFNGVPNNTSSFFDQYTSQSEKQDLPQRVIDELRHLNIDNNARESVANGQIKVQKPLFVYESQNRINVNNPISNSQWLHQNNLNGNHGERFSIDGSSKVSGCRQDPPSSESFSNVRLSNVATPGTVSDQVVSASGAKSGSTRTKTWANIAGQPPKGSAAVLHNSSWSAKRTPGHNFEPNTNRSSATGSSQSVSKNFTCVSVKSNHPDNKITTEEQASLCPNVENSGEPKANSANPAKVNSLSTDESLQALQRESEALHQKLSEVINPTKFDTRIEKARFFVIKSFSEDDIHRSIKYSIWCSTELGNKKLDAAFVEANNNFPIYLFFSVNGSGHFCGMAEMTSRVDYNARANVWAQDKWQGKFSVRWIFVKDVPNTALRHIRIETNENKPVTHSRDTTELPLERGRQVVQVFANYSHTLSIFDDFLFYEQRERQEKKVRPIYKHVPVYGPEVHARRILEIDVADNGPERNQIA